MAQSGKRIGHEAVHAHGVQIARHRDQDFHLGYDSQTMGRLLVLIVLVVAAVWLVRRALRRALGPIAPHADAPSHRICRAARCQPTIYATAA